MKSCWRAKVVNRIAQALLMSVALLSFFEAGAQTKDTPLLERSVTISFENETLEVALKKVSQLAGFTFSYNPSVIKADRIISGNYVSKTVREILDDLFK